MDFTFWGGIAAVLIVLFLILSAWQRGLDRSERDKTLEKLRTSQDRGTHKALAQSPQIKPYLCIGCSSCIRACPEDEVLGLINGIAHVIHGSRCVGHARCQDACPVGAITVGLGDLKSRPDIPVLSEHLETSVPGIFIAGELGGMALIRHAVEQGARAVDVVAQRLGSASRPAQTDLFDLVIVGAGPAGLSASLRASERELRFVTLSADDLGGTIRKYPRSKLTLVQTVDIPTHGRLSGGEYSKESLVRLWEGLIQRQNILIRTGTTLTGVARASSGFELKTSAGPLRSRFVLLALGRRGIPRRLNVPGEEQEHVFYQLIDTATYQHKDLLVIGGGDSAVEAAIGLANQPGNRVTLSYRRAAFTRLKSRNEKRLEEYAKSGRVKLLLSSDVQRIESKAVVLSVSAPARPESLRIPADYVFICAGGDPPFPLLQQVGIRFGADAAA